MKALLVGGVVIYEDGRYNVDDESTTVTKAPRMRKVETARHTDFFGLPRNFSVSWHER